MTKLGKLKQLPINKTVVFRSPIEADDVLVRSGIISDSSSFFHCLLYAYSKEYPSMDNKERIDFVQRFRSSITGKVNRESWQEMDGGMIAKIPFQENMSDIILNCYRFLCNDQRAKGNSTHRVIKTLIGNDEKNIDVYKLISELIPLKDGFEKNIIPSSEDKKFSELQDKIIKNSIIYINKKKEIKSVSHEKAEYIRNCVCKFVSTVIKEASDEAFKDYVEGRKNLFDNIDTYTINIVSKRFKRDIYFLDSKYRMPYNNSATNEHLKGRKSIVVLCLGGNQYEIIGKLLPGNHIQREFEHTDPIIQKMYTFLVNPEKVSRKFPELIKYLPDEYKELDSDKNSDKNSDNDSDKNSDNDSDNDSDQNSDNDSDKNSDNDKKSNSDKNSDSEDY